MGECEAALTPEVAMEQGCGSGGPVPADLDAAAGLFDLYRQFQKQASDPDRRRGLYRRAAGAWGVRDLPRGG